MWMANWMRWSLGLVLALGVSAISQCQLTTLRADLMVAKEGIRAAQQSTQARDALIHTLQEHAERQNHAVQRLQSTQEAIRSTYTQREDTIRRSYEKGDNQTWAITHLPDSIIRLRTHGPYTHAAAYFPSLPTCAPLPLARESSTDQR